MKAQFKYAFLTGIRSRGAVFAVTVLMMLVFIILGSLDMLPLAGRITAVALGGVAITVMMAVNIISDVAICRRMFAAPGAYLFALTPAPRYKNLFASLVAMMVLDVVTMAAVITGEVWLSFNITDSSLWSTVWNVAFINSTGSDIVSMFWLILLMFAGYLLCMLIILFSVTAKNSFFYKMKASGLLAFLLGCGCVYAVSLLNFIFAPFGTVWRYGLTFTITISNTMLPFYLLLTLLEAAVLFALTSKLMERKMNI